MTHLVMFRREIAGVLITLTAAVIPQPGPHPRRHTVTLGWTSRRGGHVTVSARFTDAKPASTGRRSR